MPIVQVDETLAQEVLARANEHSGATLTLAPGEDLPLTRFGFNSFSTLSFIVDLEHTFRIEVDEAALTDGSLESIRSVAAMVAARTLKREVGA